MQACAEGATARPTPVLRRFVDRYVGYRLTGFEPGLHHGLPSRHMTFIVSVGPAIEVVAQTDRRRPPATYRCVVGGLQAAPALISHTGHQEGVAVELTPLGSRALLGMPARELWNLSVELADLAGAGGHELWERLQGTVDWAARFAVCDDVLARMVDPHSAVPLPLDHCWDALVRSHGTVPVASLAADMGWSRQHLARRFSAELGLGPKLAARIVRFERARRMLQATPPFVTLAQVAATCGYYDQAHLSRDFTELAGCSARRWLADEVPFLQDDELAAVVP